MKVEVIVLFLLQLEELFFYKFGGVDVVEEQKVFLRFVIVVSGWGKLSKEEGRLQVKVSIEKEMIKFGVFF